MKQIIEIRDEQIEVRELSWKDCLVLTKKLSQSFLSVLGAGGKFELTETSIAASIVSTEAAVELLISKSTGRDSEWIDSLSAREVLPLLQAVIELNFTKEFSAGIRSIGTQVSLALTTQPQS